MPKLADPRRVSVTESFAGDPRQDFDALLKLCGFRVKERRNTNLVGTKRSSSTLVLKTRTATGTATGRAPSSA